MCGKWVELLPEPARWQMLLAEVLSLRYRRYPYPFPLYEHTTPVATATAATERVYKPQRHRNASRNNEQMYVRAERIPVCALSAYRAAVHVFCVLCVCMVLNVYSSRPDYSTCSIGQRA